MFCLNQFIGYKDKVTGKVHITSLIKLEKILKDKDKIKIDLLSREYFIVPCGKCDICLSSKKRHYSNRVISQFKTNKYAYLITITFNDSCIKTINHIESSNKSEISILSKVQINNIIRNWKNKLNRYYGVKVPIHYFLCGEYGGRTLRAHYHIILMLDKPIPNLERQPVRGSHYKSSLFYSKQYGNYDIEPIDMSNGFNVSRYLTKYLTKQETNRDSRKYSIKEEQVFLKNKSSLLYFPSEFIKYSRRLGISNNDIDNINNKVFNKYYLQKLKDNYDLKNWNQKHTILDYYNLVRNNNIKKYFGKNQKVYKSRKKHDIF